MKRTWLALLCIVSLTLAVGNGCKKEETVGDRIDSAVEQAADATEEAAEEAGEAADDAAKAVEEAGE